SDSSGANRPRAGWFSRARFCLAHTKTPRATHPRLLCNNLLLLDHRPALHRVLVQRWRGLLRLHWSGRLILGHARRALHRRRADHDLHAAIARLAFGGGVAGNRPLIAEADVANPLRADMLRHQLLGHADRAM